MKRTHLVVAIIAVATLTGAGAVADPNARRDANQLTFHGTPQRTGCTTRSGR